MITQEFPTSDTFKPKVRRIKVKQGTALEHEIELAELIDLNRQDIIERSEIFRETATECNWNDSDVCEMLKLLVNKELKHIILGNKTPETILESLLKHKYSTLNARQYLKILNEIKQENFILIKNYYQSIVKETRKLSICVNLSERKADKKVEEIFFLNLTPLTVRELARNEKTDLKEILKYITDVENAFYPL